MNKQLRRKNTNIEADKNKKAEEYKYLGGQDTKRRKISSFVADKNTLVAEEYMFEADKNTLKA